MSANSSRHNCRAHSYGCSRPKRRRDGELWAGNGREFTEMGGVPTETGRSPTKGQELDRVPEQPQAEVWRFDEPGSIRRHLFLSSTLAGEGPGVRRLQHVQASPPHPARLGSPQSGHFKRRNEAANKKAMCTSSGDSIHSRLMSIEASYPCEPCVASMSLRWPSRRRNLIRFVAMHRTAPRPSRREKSWWRAGLRNVHAELPIAEFLFAFIGAHFRPLPPPQGGTSKPDFL
jgi:hypothetical protein